MMLYNETLIDANNLSRKFARNWSAMRKYGTKQTLYNLLGSNWQEDKLLPGEFWAIKGVSFKLERGESVGIMGLNGAGKSTLLKMVAGLLLPSSGEVRVRGKLDSLIELGTGFHPSLSGRENVYIRCALNNMTIKQTKQSFKEIVDFAELDEFIDMPVKNYSSGMKARLGFATAIFGKPDILVVDEVLSVGDFTFQQKCLDKMNELKEHSSILFVSHAFQAIRMFCDRGIILDHGEKIFDGSASDAVDFFQEQQEKKRKTKKEKTEQSLPKRSLYGPEFQNNEKISDVNCRWVDAVNNEVQEYSRLESIYLDFSFRLLLHPKNMIIGVPVWNSKEELITAFASDMAEIDFHIGQDGWVRGRLEIYSGLNADTYQAVFSICDGPEYFERLYLPKLNIKGKHPRIIGSAQLNHKWSNIVS